MKWNNWYIWDDRWWNVNERKWIWKKIEVKMKLKWNANEIKWICIWYEIELNWNWNELNGNNWDIYEMIDDEM